MSEKSTTAFRRETSPKIGDAVTIAEARPAPLDVRHGANLLECARIQWQFGDWKSLAQLTPEILQPNPERGTLAMLAAAGRLQIGQIVEARYFIQLARDWGVSEVSICQILAAGVHNSLGRAAAIANQWPRAVQHFENAIKIAASGSDTALLTHARIAEQLNQLGLSDLKGRPEVGAGMPEARVIAKSALPVWIREALKYAPDAPPLLIAAAEAAQRNGELDTAIRYWQRLAAVEGMQMEQPYYERLAQAYREIKSFPLASVEDEILRGDTDKHQVLERIHQTLQPRNYLEIGVQTGQSLLLATCPAIGVDPMPMIAASSEKVRLVRSTSDQFFAEQASNYIHDPIDMAFIDGMHLFEYALRDFMNIERYAKSHTLIVMDDIFPGASAQAARDRHTRAWTGDVWKLLPIFRQYRPDLSLLLLDAHPTGLLCVTGLNPENTILREAYKRIVVEWSGNVPVPDEILKRKGSLPCAHPGLDILMNQLSEKRLLSQNQKI